MTLAQYREYLLSELETVDRAISDHNEDVKIVTLHLPDDGDYEDVQIFKHNNGGNLYEHEEFLNDCFEDYEEYLEDDLIQDIKSNKVLIIVS